MDAVRPLDPTPEEIAEACRNIRKEWDEAEHWRRAGYSRRAGWLPPETRFMLRLDDLDDAFAARPSTL